MAEDKEFQAARRYFAELNLIKSEVLEILDEGDEKKIVRAARKYPERLNHLLMKRNIKSATILFPFIDLPILQERKKELDLIDLNTPKNEIELLEELIRRIDREFELE